MSMWFLILVAIAVVGVEGTCPSNSSIYPCTCWTLLDKTDDEFSTITCRNLQSEQALVRVVSQTRGLDVFELELFESNLRFIPHDVFKGTTFEVINIENSSISALSDTDTAFEGLEKSLHLLEINNVSFVSNWEWRQLSHINRLMEIVITNSDLQGLIGGLNSLQREHIESFVFQRSSIEWLEDYVFAPFKYLQRVTLDKNYIKELKRSMFPRPAENLKIVGLSYNQLTSLPDDLFVDMPELSSLYLTGNPLRTIDEIVFRPIWNQIHLLFFSGTDLSCDCRLAWIIMSDNSRKFIHADCFGPLQLRGRSLTSMQTHELWC